MSSEDTARIGAADRADRDFIGETLRFVAERGWRDSDGEFLSSLAAHFGDMLGVSHVLVGRRMAGAEDTIRTVSFWADGALVENVEYPLAGSPCETVADQDLRSYVSGVRERFPADAMLAELGVESYAGMPLRSGEGDTLGLIAVLDRKPLRDPELIETLLRIVALRASAELERRELLAEQERYRNRTRDFAEASSDWFWEMDEDLRFTWFSANVETALGIPPEWYYGKSRADVGGGNASSAEWEAHLEAMRRHEPFKDFLYGREGPAGFQWIRTSGVPVFDAKGEFRGYRGTGSDVTAEMEARKEAERANTRLFSAIENLDEAFVLWDPDDRLVICNGRFREINAAAPASCAPGIDFSEHVRMLLEAGVYTEAAGREEEWYLGRLERHRARHGPYEVARTDGTWLMINEQKLPDGSTATIYLDITRRRRDELALQESEDLLDSIVENIAVGILIKDENHIVERANSTYLGWYGFDTETMLGRRSDEIEDFQAPDEAERMNAQEREVLTTGRILHREVERPFADGRLHTVSITKFPVYDRDGRAIKVGSVSVDLTDQVEARRALAESEAKFRDFAESASDWLWEMDEDLRFTRLSDRYKEITGVDPAEFIGRTRPEMAAEAAATEKWKRHLDDLANHRSFRDFRYDVVRSNGTPMTVSISGKPVFDATGGFQGYRGSGADITEQRRAEQARDAALEAAEQANRTKSEFLAAMSHELRTPLNAILRLSDSLSSEYFGSLGSARYREYADDIHSSAAHLLELVNDLLDISAIEAGKTALEMEAISVAAIVEDCVHTFAAAVKTKGLTIESDVREDLPDLHADRRAVKQVLLNLLSNAVKFTRAGGRIWVEAEVDDTEARIVVADTGAGIPADRMHEITDPFIRADGGAYMSEKGWGLGLSISRSLVDLHGGTLDIESQVGRGTRVIVVLPNAVS